MLTISVLFVGLTLATAVIAYWSDNLGKKLGKKRVSLWNMRPRTTATFLTIASSWVIMVFTLVVLLAIYSPLRQALWHYQSVKDQERKLSISARALKKQVGGLQGQLTDLQNQTSYLQRQVASATKHLDEVSKQLGTSKTAAQQARKEREVAQRDASAAQADAKLARQNASAATKRERQATQNLGLVTHQRNSTQQQRDQAQEQLNNARANLTDAKAKVDAANAKVSAANAKVSAANAKVSQANAQYTAAQNQLTRVKTELGKAKTAEATAKINERISTNNAKAAEVSAAAASRGAFTAGQEVLAADERVAQADRQVAAARREVAVLEKQRQELLDANRQIALDANTVLLTDVRVPVGRTLVARSFEQTPTFFAAREALRAMFERSAQIAPGLLPGASLELEPLPTGDQSSPLRFAPSDVYSNLADYIVGTSGAVSVRLVAARNHLEGERILDAQFIVVPVRSALPADYELSQVVLDGSIGDARLFSALLELVDAAREVALRKGVTPPLSPESPNFYAPGSREQIFQTLRALSEINGPARVSIVTQQSIANIDPLHVRFDIEPLGSAAGSDAAAPKSAARAVAPAATPAT